MHLHKHTWDAKRMRQHNITPWMQSTCADTNTLWMQNTCANTISHFGCKAHALTQTHFGCKTHAPTQYHTLDAKHMHLHKHTWDAKHMRQHNITPWMQSTCANTHLWVRGGVGLAWLCLTRNHPRQLLLKSWPVPSACAQT